MRVDGWEDALQSLVEQARHRPYELGRHDCFTLACSVVAALAGEHHGDAFIGLYATKQQAIDLIHSHGETFEEAFDWCFGMRRKPVAMATRGDILAVQLAGEKHLALCVGKELACLAEDGLIFLPVTMAHCAWDVQCPRQ